MQSPGATALRALLYVIGMGAAESPMIRAASRRIAHLVRHAQGSTISIMFIVRSGEQVYLTRTGVPFTLRRQNRGDATPACVHEAHRMYYREVSRMAAALKKAKSLSRRQEQIL